jgi:hypothetical protein
MIGGTKKGTVARTRIGVDLSRARVFGIYISHNRMIVADPHR